MIKVEGLYKELGGQPVLEDITFNVSGGRDHRRVGLKRGRKDRAAQAFDRFDPS